MLLKLLLYKILLVKHQMFIVPSLQRIYRILEKRKQTIMIRLERTKERSKGSVIIFKKKKD